AEPLEIPVHHWPVCKTRPVISALPSPLKSATFTSTQVTFGFQISQRVLVKAVEPLEMPTHQSPVWATRPAMSALPSPLKSPTFTSTQVTFGFQWVHRLLVKDVPVDRPTHQSPDCKTRPAISILPSPLRSPTMTLTQVTWGFQLAHNSLIKEKPV